MHENIPETWHTEISTCDSDEKNSGIVKQTLWNINSWLQGRYKNESV